jgi:hypothetical protein
MHFFQRRLKFKGWSYDFLQNYHHESNMQPIQGRPLHRKSFSNYRFIQGIFPGIGNERRKHKTPEIETCDESFCEGMNPKGSNVYSNRNSEFAPDPEWVEPTFLYMRPLRLTDVINIRILLGLLHRKAIKKTPRGVWLVKGPIRY